MKYFTKKEKLVINFASKIFENAVRSANILRNLSNDKSIVQSKYGLNDIEWSSIVFEYIYFFLHLTDRMIFTYFSEEQREEIMKSLEEYSIFSSVEAIYKGYPQDTLGKIKSECLDNFNVSQSKYSKYKKMYFEKNESPKDTLYYEFSKNIANLSGKENDILVVSSVAFNEAIKSHVNLKINDFVKNLKRLNKKQSIIKNINWSKIQFISLALIIISVICCFIISLLFLYFVVLFLIINALAYNKRMKNEGKNPASKDISDVI